MKLTYSGKSKDFTPELEEKCGAKLAKLSKFIERRGEREAHVRHSTERHLHKVEIIVNAYERSLVGEGADADLDTAMCQAIEKLEKQIVNLSKKFRDIFRDAKSVRATKENGNSGEDTGLVLDKSSKPAKMVANGKPKIFRVDYNDGHKPMTVEEAVLEMEHTADYMVYRDSDRNCLSVLVRRSDGNFDLIES